MATAFADLSAEDIDLLSQHADRLTEDERLQLRGVLNQRARGCRVNRWMNYVRPKLHRKQIMALSYEGRELLYGGAAGGGKSDYLLLAMMQYLDVPDYGAIIFRRTFPDLNQKGSIMNRAKAWFTPLNHLGVQWSASERSWYFPTSKGKAPSRLSFAYLADENDRLNYQGAEFNACVGRGTPVQMANGHFKPVETIVVGDVVRTLEGPRSITRVHPIRRIAAVECIAERGGEIIGRQVQSANHCLLTKQGWVSCDASLSTLRRGVDRYAEQSWLPFQCVPQPHARQLTDRQQPFSRRRSPLGRQSALASVVCMEQPTRGIDCEVSGYEHEVFWPHASGHLRPMPSIRQRGRVVACGAENELRDGAAGDRLATSLLDCQGHYLEDCDPCGGNAHLLLTDGLICPPLPGDAEQQTPRDWKDDANRQTQKYNHHKWWYAHPYTKGVRQTREERKVVSFEFIPVSDVDLYDLTVEGASHYITGCGFVNKNCAFDELTQHPRASYSYLFSRLRRLSGSNVPSRMRAATNPGGPHGEWVKGDFITEDYLKADTETQFSKTWEKVTPCDECEQTGMLDRAPCLYCEGVGHRSRMFVPSRLLDNPSIDAAEYLRSLIELSPVERYRLEKGDWSITEQGDLFKTEWVRYYSRNGDHFRLHRPGLPDVVLAIQELIFFITADTASKEKTTADFTCISTWAFHQRTGSLLLIHSLLSRMEVPRIGEAIINQSRAGRCQFVRIESAQCGIGVIQELRGPKGDGIAVQDYNPNSGDKVARSTTAQIKMEAGQIYFPDGRPNWLDAPMAQMIGFPQATHDDFVDTLSMAADWAHSRHQTGAGGPPAILGPIGR